MELRFQEKKFVLRQREYKNILIDSILFIAIRGRRYVEKKDKTHSFERILIPMDSV